MKRLTAALLFLVTTTPAHAAPRSCRTATTARIRHVSAASHVANHNAAHANLVITAFAVPVAVLVAPFAPYWYGIADYRDDFSLQDSASQCDARKAPPRAQNGDAAYREAEPRGSAFPGRAWKREGASRESILSQKCATCHGRTSPKMGLSLVDPWALSADDRLRAIRAVVKGAMPPDGEQPLSTGERDAILRELASEYPTEE